MLKQSFAETAKVGDVPAAFRRLCVETAEGIADIGTQIASRLQAAVC